MGKRWPLVLAVLVGLVLSSPAQVPPVIISRFASQTDLRVFRNLLAGIDDASWRVAFRIGPCRRLEFKGQNGRYAGQFQFQNATSPLACQIPFTYQCVAQIPSVPPDRLSHRMSVVFLPVGSPVVIDSLVALQFMVHVIDRMPRQLTAPLDLGFVYNGMACTRSGGRVTWVLAVGTPQGTPLYDLTVSADVFPGGGFGKLVFR